MYYFYVEIEYVATSFSPARTDLAVKLLNNTSINQHHFKVYMDTDQSIHYVYQPVRQVKRCIRIEMLYVTSREVNHDDPIFCQQHNKCYQNYVQLFESYSKQYQNYVQLRARQYHAEGE